MRRTLILLPMLGLLGLAACGGVTDTVNEAKAAKDAASSVDEPAVEPADEPEADEPEVEPVREDDTSGSDAEFAMSFAFSPLVDDLGEAGQHMTDGADAAYDMDIAGMIMEMEAGADLFESMSDGAADLDGADSDFGQQVIDTFDFCEAALRHGIEAASDLDADEMSSSGQEMTECGEQLTETSEVLESLMS